MYPKFVKVALLRPSLIPEVQVAGMLMPLMPLYQSRTMNTFLNGTYRYVPNGHTADVIIVAARNTDTSGQKWD